MNSPLPTAAQWPEISRLLDDVLALPAEGRAAWLARLAQANPVHHEALRGLLATLERVEEDDFLDELPHLEVGAAARPPELSPGQAVGPYRLVREIGVGGMGTVWLAERTDAGVLRRVALKLPRAVWGGSFAERLERESRILAALEHDHIARLYDAGLDTQGRPFLALEYVEGQPIDVYCNERALPLRSREILLLQTMAAVSHAHARLVVHRDLKPANILVTRDGRVKLLDFGIAKLIESDVTADTLTQLAGRALTPDYASPEQIRGEPLGTASDVYSLGVVAYELLAQARPYRLRRGSAAEMEEAIASAEPTLASAAARAPELRRALRGDLDAILNKALKKSVADRYASVDAFANDLRRHLDGKPVHARPDSRRYRMAKFVRRNGLAVGLGSTLAASILVGGGLAGWQALVARHQESRAEIEVARQKAVRDLYDETMMGLAVTAREHPEALAHPHAVADALRDKLHEMAPRYAKAPQERAAQLEAVALQLNYDNDFESALAVGQEYLAHLKAHDGTPIQVIDAYNMLGRNFGLLRRYEESEAVRRAGVAWAAGGEPDDDATRMSRLQIATDLGNLLTRRGKREEALQVLERAQLIAAGVPAGNASRYETGYSLSAYFQAFDEARELQAAQAAQDGMDKVTTLDPDERLSFMKYYGDALMDNGKLVQAEATFQAARTLNAKSYGRNSLNNARAVGILASAIARQGDYARANALLDEEMLFLSTARSAVAPAVLAKLQERRMESDWLAGDVDALQARISGDPTTLSTPAQAPNNVPLLLVDARALALVGRGAEAVAVAEFTRTHWPAPGLATATCINIQQALALVQLAAGRPADARATARVVEALFEREHALAGRSSITMREIDALASARLGDLPAAARALASADGVRPAPPYPSDVVQADSLVRRAEVLQAIGRAGDATAAARQALALLKSQHPDSPRLAQARRLAGA